MTLVKKYGIKINDYIPIWHAGTNYVYDVQEIPKLLIALKKFLSYGGPDGVVKGVNSLTGQAMTSSQFVAAGGLVAIAPGKLSPLGTSIIEAYDKLAKALQAAIHNTEKRSLLASAFQRALDVYKLLHSLGAGGGHTIDYKVWKDIAALPEKIKRLKDDDLDVVGLEQLFFGFDSIKNKMHNRLREYARTLVSTPKDKWFQVRERDLDAVWGDIDLAIDMLGRF